MINLFRSGPRMVILETPIIDDCLNNMTKKFSCMKIEKNTMEHSFENTINDLFSLADDKMSIVILTDTMKDNLELFDIKVVLLVVEKLENFLCSLINDMSEYNITNTRIGPRILVVKAIGDIDKVINLANKEMPSTFTEPDKMYKAYNDGTLIAFTDKNFTTPVSLNEVYGKCLHTNLPYNEILKNLRSRNLKYLNVGIGNQDWYEITVKIYDSCGHFDLHYDRLVYALEALELGIILGESWGRDAATVFRSVGVYTVRLFTYKEPKYIKTILVGLEYLSEEVRLVDYDLFYKKRKIHWDDVRTREVKRKTALGVYYRSELLKMLSEENIATLSNMEDEILKSKNNPK
jgi:hypothetical protein